jgi:hypothetical protein
MSTVIKQLGKDDDEDIDSFQEVSGCVIAGGILCDISNIMNRRITETRNTI